jgi:uncharacterized protein (DUF488 family)
MTPLLFTIGFTKKSAAEFFSILRHYKILVLADVRINNISQLTGFTKKNDLKFFLKLFNIEYEYWQDFVPSKEIRNNWIKNKNWAEYEQQYNELLKERKAVEKLNGRELKSVRIVLLCAEAMPDFCHRRLAAEAIKIRYPEIEIIHL